MSGTVPPASAGRLDGERLGKLRDLGRQLGEDLLGEVVRELRAKARAQLAEVADAVARGDAAVAERIGHSLKGSAGNVGARRLRELAAALEDRARDGDVAAVGGLVPALAAEVEATLRALDEWVADAEGPGVSGRPRADTPNPAP